jgi:hypothetical protein
MNSREQVEGHPPEAAMVESRPKRYLKEDTKTDKRAFEQLHFHAALVPAAENGAFDHEA